MKYICSTQQKFNNKQVSNLSNKFNVSQYIIKHLLSHNIKTEKEIALFLEPGLAQFYNPFLLNGMTEAVKKIKTAILNNKKIVIMGDYDTDGICATAILYKYFESKKIIVNYFLPNRFLDGYGLTFDSIDKIIELYNPDLLITVDCGIACHAEIDYALNKGVDVIVTDHHEVPATTPNCIYIDAKDPKQTYPFKELCGAGMALKLVHALGGLEEYLKYTNIATLATVADIVPLINENRAIVKHGLNNAETLPVGIKKLLQMLKIKELAAVDIAFKVAPKLNTAGRMGDASLAFRLFIEKNPNVINQILSELDNLNNARIEAGNDIYKDTLIDLANVNISKTSAIVLKSEYWHSGVLGIVCAKLTEKYNRPVCLLTKVDNVYKGSIRGIDGIDVYKELTKLQNLLVKFGGHEGAGGLTIEEKNISEFAKTLNFNISKDYSSSVFDNVKYYDIDMNKEQITTDFIKQLDVLEPFGFGNEKPVFKLTFNNIKPERIKNHANYFKIKAENIELLSFNLSEHIGSLNTNCNKDVLLDVTLDNYKNELKIKGIIKNIKYNKLNTNIKSEEANAYYLKQLEMAKEINNPNIYETNNENEIINKLINPMGNLIICNTFDSYLFAINKFSDFISNFDSYQIKLSSGANTLIYLPTSFANFNNYENLIFLDEVLTKDYLLNFNNNVILFKQNNNTCLKDIVTERKEFAIYHTAIQNAVKNKLTSYSAIEYFNGLKKLNVQFKNLKFNQFMFVTIVLRELKILNIIEEENLYEIEINKGINNPLTNSKIYNFVNLIKKL